MKRANFRQGGFTLIELIFVIAIIVVLASIFLPLAISKLNKADQAVADASIQEIATALTAFYDDLRHFPTCDSTDCSPFPGSGNDIQFLAFGDGYSDLSATWPDQTTGSLEWNLATSIETDIDKNNGANHVVINDPVGNGTANETTDYPTTGSKKWSGPYLARVSTDPWLRTYIAHVGKMEEGGTVVSGQGATATFGWILSAGPDNSLDTKPSSTSLVGDDRGFVFHTE